MAKILRTNEQEAALETINSTLRVLKSVNKFLESAGDTAGTESTATFMVGKNRVTIPYDSAEIARVLADFHKTNAAKVRALSKKFVIGLDEDDEKTLEGVKKEKKPSKPATAKEEPAAPAVDDADEDETIAEEL